MEESHMYYAERTQNQMTTYSILPFIWSPGDDKTIGTDRSMIAMDWRCGKELITKGHEGTVWGDGTLLYLAFGDGSMTLCIFQTS